MLPVKKTSYDKLSALCLFCIASDFPACTGLFCIVKGYDAAYVGALKWRHLLSTAA